MPRRAMWMFVLCLAVMGSVPPLAHGGQQPPAGTAAQAAGGQEPQNEFVPVKDLPQQEKLPAAPLLMSAYAFVWIALLAYVWSMWRRLQAVEREMRELSARIAEKTERR